ncbi:formyl-coenzyme A transferase [compost metagenome]
MNHLGIAQDVEAGNGRRYRLVSQPITLARTPARIAHAAPAWGEHTTEMLTEIGYTPSDIEQLQAKAAV